jgi:DNA-binding transcriptional regulator YiaG
MVGWNFVPGGKKKMKKSRGIGSVAARRGNSYAYDVRRGKNCISCVRRLEWKRSTETKPHLINLYGFNVQLAGVPIGTCRRCKIVHLDVREEQLKRTILATVLAKAGPLTASEIKFTRKTLGLTGGQFANRVGVSREHVSHIEQGHTSDLGTSADRLTRLVAAIALDPSLILLRQLFNGLDENIGTRYRRKAAKPVVYKVKLTA